MEQFYIFANQYYLDFYSFKGHITTIWKQLILSVILSILFCFAILDFLGWYLVWSDKPNLLESFVIVIVVEIAFLASWFWTVELKNKQALKKLSEKLDVETKYLQDLKRCWLQKTFKQSPYEYLDIAENFSKAIELRNKNKSAMSFMSKDDIFNLIVDENAKPRILALLLSLFSIIGVIVLREEGSLDKLLDFYSGASWQFLAVIDFIIALAGLFVLVAFKYMFSLAYVLLSVVFHSTGGKRAQSDYIAKSLIRDLIYFHRCKVAKVTLKVDSK